jgi:hypothetical protein
MKAKDDGRRFCPMCLKKFLRKHSTDLFCSEACEEAFDELSAQRGKEEAGCPKIGQWSGLCPALPINLIRSTKGVINTL